METRKCSNCGERKELNHFQKGQSYCTECSRIKYYKEKFNGILPSKVCVRCKEEKPIIENFIHNNKICITCMGELELKECRWCTHCKSDKLIDGGFYKAQTLIYMCIQCMLKVSKEKIVLPVKECKKLLREYLDKINE